MNTSAFYIKSTLIILSLALASCSSSPDRKDTDQLPVTTTPLNAEKELKNTTASELEEYKQAMRHLKDGKLDKSKEILLEFMQQRPSLAGPWSNLGLIYLKQNKLDDAEKAISEALKRNPKQAHALSLMGYIESKKGNFLKAREHYQNAVKYKNNYSTAHYNLALLYDIYFQDIAKAVIHYTAYLKIVGVKKDKKTADWVDGLKRSLKKR